MDRHVEEHAAGAWRCSSIGGGELSRLVILHESTGRRARRSPRACCTAWWPGSKRRLNPTCSSVPAASTAASAASTVARSSEIGFSQNVALAGRGGGDDQLDVGVGASCRWRRRRCRSASTSSDRCRAPGTPSSRGHLGRRAGDDVVHGGERRAGDAVGEQLGVHPADAAAPEHADPHGVGPSDASSAGAASPRPARRARRGSPVARLARARRPPTTRRPRSTRAGRWR